VVAAPELLDAAVALVAAEQARPERQITYVGTEAAGIRAELDGLDPPWATTLRTAQDASGGLVGVVVVEWDADLGRAWILGPWVAGDDDAWTTHAGPLLDAALAQLPAGIEHHELSGDLANTRLATLASARGYTTSPPSHALVADAGVVASWGDPADAGLRPAEDDDLAGIAPLHDAEFPGTYATAARLVDDARRGQRVVLVAPGREGAVAGYAAGEVHDDGEGFIDFVVVSDAARGGGIGRALVQALTRALLARSTTGQVALTVQDHRAPARALYAQLGFRPDGSFAAYRNRPHG
jgi:ribosomal protein S18 acetylase RimI-like enzyme